jgi:hypothetical protein
MTDYFDAKLPDAEMAERHPGSMDGTNASEPHETRAYLRSRGFLPEYLVRYVYRPFDMRWIYWEPETKLLGRKSPALFRNVFPGNLFIEARQRQVKSNFDRGYVVTKLPDNFGSGFSSFFPLLIAGSVDRDKTRPHHGTPDMFGTGVGSGDTKPLPNLTPFAFDYLAKLGAEPEDLFFHVVALLHAAAYRTENAGALRQDWPRVPLPNSADTLRAGAALGRQVAALLDPETDVPGVTSGKIRPELRGLGELTVAADARPKTPDLALVARWGYFGQGGVVMPGPGDVRTGTRGGDFVDIHLNATTRWKDVPVTVWDYTLGGYPVLKKWLSYRESALFGRAIREDEALDFTHNARRIAALLDLRPALDANYAETTTAAEKVTKSQFDG